MAGKPAKATRVAQPWGIERPVLAEGKGSEPSRSLHPLRFSNLWLENASSVGSDRSCLVGSVEPRENLRWKNDLETQATEAFAVSKDRPLVCGHEVRGIASDRLE